MINSTYFEESLKLIGNRFDLQIKMLELYEDIILNKRDSLIQTNTLSKTNLIQNKETFWEAPYSPKTKNPIYPIKENTLTSN